jgi:hypothetical protein
MEADKPDKKRPHHTLRFRDAAALDAWLEYTIEGAEVVRRIVDRRLGGKESCLIVLSSDGWIEVYCERTVQVHIAHRLHVTTRETAQLADEYMDVALPRRFKRLFIPGRLRATGRVERWSAERELRKLEQLADLSVIREIGEGLKSSAPHYGARP